ncbi:MAG: TaqI-like C-terminal specificity domain-containing protein [Halobacteriota archaeon]
MKEQAKQEVKKLVERFRYNLDVYKKSAYNEAQVRREFIDPFFEALGWDVSNKQGYAEQYKEVVHEDTIKVGGSTRAPDYSFRIGGQRKFFVEAKKPAVNIKEDVSPSYQLRRYAWSAKLPLSVVTDFEELSIFDCRIKPSPNDKAGVGRIAYFTFDEYLDKFDEIYDVFSKEAVLKGSFDRYAQSTKGKKGTAEVDSEFLKEIESWRELLAKNVALRNQDVSIYELNYAVQKLLDRIIFLRICEDRGIEPYGQLQTKAESDDVYTHLMNHFKLAESKYNSGIFDFDADKITTSLSIDDRVLKTIIQSLYYPKSPYEFSVLGVEILGNVYEQFLGKVIRLTAGHQAKVETKPEVKKAGGVYYTPQYIVDYIVRNTVGKLVAGKTPDAIAEIKLVDPACGSGSFLIGAYTYLLRYHLDWYAENKPKKHKEAVFQVRENEWYLTTAEKKRILLNNIFGVDIDPQAVEVTKLSLLLKVLEHESRESIDQQVKLGLEGMLPNLGGNVKCGNSLIGTDFYGAGQQERLFDEAEMRRVNVFDWDDERKGFGGIMKRGGFDAVIGNPPYLNLTVNTCSADVLSYYGKRYKSFVSAQSKNLFAIFIERSLQLMSSNASLSFIVPEGLTRTRSYAATRKLMTEHAALQTLLLFDSRVFENAVIGNIIFVLTTEDHAESYRVQRMHSNLSIEDICVISYDPVEQTEDNMWKTTPESAASSLVAKIQSSYPMADKMYKFYKGMVVKNRKNHLRTELREGDLPFLLGSNLDRYRLQYKFYTTYNELTIVGGTKVLAKHMECPRLLVRRTGDYLCVTFSDEPQLVESTLYIVAGANRASLLYLLGLLNSKLFTFIVRQKMITNKQAFPQILMTDLKQLPIRTIGFSNPAEKAQHDKLVSLVDNMLELQKKYHETRMDRDKELYERQIKIVDAQIDRLVYDLYGLTEEEIEVVEGE